MTGIASNVVTKLNLQETAEVVKSTNEKIAKIIGINKAARNTTIKPSGTTSCVLGTSSGIHAWHNDYYIRRIRIMKNDPLYIYLINNHPELVEDDKLRSHDTAVIAIPQKAPKGSILRTETALDLLERTRRFNLEWVKEGHRKGANTNNVSATISINKNTKYSHDKKGLLDLVGSNLFKNNSPVDVLDEWKAVGEWMWQNKDTFNGLSVLPYDNGSYIQAPFEDCTEEQYNKMMEALKDIDLRKVVETEDNTDLTGEVACSGGMCSL